MSAGIVGFILGAMFGGTFGTIVMTVLIVGDDGE